MNTADFEASLARDGFKAVLRDWPAGMTNETHSHAWEVRAIITEGDITLTVDGASRLYKQGDVFTMAAGCMHKEVVGSSGVKFIAGRRDPQIA